MKLGTSASAAAWEFYIDGSLVSSGSAANTTATNHGLVRLGWSGSANVTANVWFDDLTIEENIQVAAERQTAKNFLLDLVRPGRQRDRAGVDFAFEVLGIGDLAKKYPNEISQGQRKLVSAARALAARPELVCMDRTKSFISASSVGLALRTRSGPSAIIERLSSVTRVAISMMT